MPVSAERTEALNKALTMIQSVTPPFIPSNAEVMTVIIEWPPGDPGAPPHRHPGGPPVGHVPAGEMLFEPEGQPPRGVEAGEAARGPRGDADTGSRADD